MYPTDSIVAFTASICLHLRPLRARAKPQAGVCPPRRSPLACTYMELSVGVSATVHRPLEAFTLVAFLVLTGTWYHHRRTVVRTHSQLQIGPKVSKKKTRGKVAFIYLVAQRYW